jgi:hypothetical protein
MPYPKRLHLRRMQVRWRQPNGFERSPLGDLYAEMRWSAHLDKGDHGEFIVRLTSRTQPPRGDVIQAVICLVVRRWPHATTADLMDLAGCSRETAWRRKQLAYRINAEYDAQLAARTAVTRRTKFQA